MRIIAGLEGLRSLPGGSVLSIGNFDGVHRGHRRILQSAREIQSSTPGAALAVVTFEPHPLTVLRPQAVPPRLTPPPLKQSLLAAEGVDYLVNLPPTRQILDLSAEDFWHILRDQVRPSHLVEGSSFNFGKNRGGTIERLKEWAGGSDIQLHVIEAVSAPLLNLHVVPVSSSLIRWLLEHGRMRDAAICLGQSYLLEGTAIQGRRRGREIGVPTANLDCGEQLIPMDGVYSGRCQIDGTVYPVAVSIGTAPTFGDDKRQIEAHLIGFNGDLYGRKIQVEMADWLRDQRKFFGVESLKKQLSRDIEGSVERSERRLVEPIAILEGNSPRSHGDTEKNEEKQPRRREDTKNCN